MDGINGQLAGTGGSEKVRAAQICERGAACGDTTASYPPAILPTRILIVPGHIPAEIPDRLFPWKKQTPAPHLLDFDDTRAPRVLYSYAAYNEKSREEWKKHQSSAGFSYHAAVPSRKHPGHHTGFLPSGDAISVPDPS